MKDETLVYAEGASPSQGIVPQEVTPTTSPLATKGPPESPLKNKVITLITLI